MPTGSSARLRARIELIDAAIERTRDAIAVQRQRMDETTDSYLAAVAARSLASLEDTLSIQNRTRDLLRAGADSDCMVD